MSLEVDRVLYERARRTGRLGAASLVAALLLHAGALALALLLPRLTPPPKPLEFVPVQIIPAQALGVRRPAPPRRKSPPAPEPVKEVAETPAPEPRPEPAPVPEPAAEAPVLPDPGKKKPEETKPPARKPEAPVKPAETGRKPEKPSTGPAETGRPSSGKAEPGVSGTAPGETGDQLGRRGGPQGNPLGTTAFGSEVAGLDNPDFTYGYYLDRLLSLIDAQWARPNMASGVTTVLFFRIGQDGSMSELKVEQSSGYNAFDLAAFRAVQNAAPFPPLPRAFKHDSLGVRLIVR